ncbi:hypothetical protein B0H14DRAFT_2417421, partial [Mycena olivaceomarginata]
YGQLQQILVCTLPANSIFRVFSGQTRLLAVITPCSTAGRDAAKQLVSYTQTNNTIVTDLQAVSAGIGRMATRNKWVIVDRPVGTSGLSLSKQRRKMGRSRYCKLELISSTLDIIPCALDLQ